MILFEGNRGRVVRLDDPAAQLSIGFVDVDEPISYAATRSIITRLTIGQQANVQFLHTLGSHIYIYVFGDRIGQMGLSGISFNAPCEYGGAGAGVGGGDIGIVKMLGWYKAHRVSETGLPVRVTVGNLVIEGFVTGATFDTIEPESGLVQWGLNMHSLPDFVPPPAPRPATTSTSWSGVQRPRPRLAPELLAIADLPVTPAQAVISNILSPPPPPVLVPAYVPNRSLPPDSPYRRLPTASDLTTVPPPPPAGALGTAQQPAGGSLPL